MTYEPVQPTPIEQKALPLGPRLRSAREALGIDRKEAATQLRLPEKIIAMMESGYIKSELPMTFIRGYLRSYGKFLEIPEPEIKQAMEALTPKPTNADGSPAASGPKAATPYKPRIMTATRSLPINLGNFFMRLFTFLLFITLISLTAIWWHSHKPTDMQLGIEQIDDSQQATPMSKSAAATTEASPVEQAPGSKNNVSTDTNTQTNASNIVPVISNAPVKKEAEATKKTISAQDIDQAVLAYVTPQMTVEQLQSAALGKMVADDMYLQSLLDFILFLAVFNLSLRLYYPFPTLAHTTQARLNRKPIAMRPSFNFQRLFKLANKFKLPSSFQFFSFLVVVSALSLINFLWHHHNATAAPMTLAAKQVSTKGADYKLGTDLQLDADLESLAPSSNLDSVILKAFKISALQAMVNELDHLANQAQAVKFALTDPSTEIGQFTYKKKNHRHRQVYPQYYDQNDQSGQTEPVDLNDTQTNSENAG